MLNALMPDPKLTTAAWTVETMLAVAIETAATKRSSSLLIILFSN
jgi:hypothetical protein